jgi:uncharacterized protein (TIGR02453 family)
VSESPASTFAGFPVAALDFYDDLEVDNTRAYWEKHKDVYTESVKAPMAALCAALAPEFGEAKVFRPYRDVRFSADKTPYKTHQGAVVRPEEGVLGAWYVQISAEGLMVGGGVWRLESDQVARYRRAVVDDLQGPRLVAEVERLKKAGYGIGGDRLTRTPKGFDVDDEIRADLLLHKAITSHQHWEPADWLHERSALDRVRSAWRDFVPLNQWLADNVGVTTKEIRRR